jgi:hypothetical protein
MANDRTDKPRPVPLTARHTLGSDPEAAGTPLRGAPEPGEGGATPSELVRPVWWVATQEQAEAWNESDPRTRTVARRAVAQVDQMWSVVDEVERLAQEGGPQEKAPVQRFREFLNREIVGVFVDLVRHVSLAIAGAEGWRLTDFDECSERFSRYLDLARLASSDALIPPIARTIVQQANPILSDSLPDLAALVGALATLHAHAEHGSRRW